MRVYLPPDEHGDAITDGATGGKGEPQIEDGGEEESYLGVVGEHVVDCVDAGENGQEEEHKAST